MFTCKYKCSPLVGIRPVQSASVRHLSQVALTVSKIVPRNPRLRRFHRMDMYRLYMYKNRESLHEAFGARQTYRTSMSMHRRASYTRRAVRVINQYRTEVLRHLRRRTEHTRNHHSYDVGRSPARMYLSYTPNYLHHENLQGLIDSNELCNAVRVGRRHISAAVARAHSNSQSNDRVESCGCFRGSSSRRLFISGTHIKHCILSTVLSVRGASSLIAIGFMRRVRCVQCSGSLPKIVHGDMDRRARFRSYKAPSCVCPVLSD